MTENNDASTNSGASPNLKVLESEVLVDTPWHDDVLNREEIAERLTNLIGTQSVPFVVSVHGAWGTGKTFMLKRWQKDLESECFQAIYFNAWDDDFCDDPLIAIIGQLSDYFNDSKYSGIKNEIQTATNSLIRRSSVTLSVGVASITTRGHVNMCVNVIRRQPSLVSVQRRFRPCRRHPGRRPSSVPAPSASGTCSPPPAASSRSQLSPCPPS